MRPNDFITASRGSGGPLQSCLCYFDIGWQWGGHRGHKRQCFTSESRSDLTWIKWRNSQHWLLQPPALWGNVSSGLVGEVRTAQSAAPACRFTQRRVGYLQTPPPLPTATSILPLLPPPRADPQTPFMYHTLTVSEDPALLLEKKFPQCNPLTLFKMRCYLTHGYEHSRWEAKCAVHTYTFCCHVAAPADMN